MLPDKKSIATSSWACAVRKARHVGDGRGDGRCMLSFAKSASESRGRSVRLDWSNRPRVGWAVGPERGSQPSAPPRRGGSYRGRVAPPGWMDSVGVGMGGAGPVGGRSDQAARRTYR